MKGAKEMKKCILLPVIQSVFEETSYSDAYLIANYLWNLMSAINTICISQNCVLSGLYKKRKCCFGIAVHMSINLMHNLMYLVNQ